MGGNINGSNDKIDGIIKSIEQSEPKKTGAGTGAETDRSSTPATGNKGAGAKAGTGTGAGTTAGTEEKKPVGLAVVDEAEQKRLERNAKRRERYAKEKAENGGTVKPRKVNKSKKSEPEPIDKTTLNSMIIGLSAVIASRPNCEHWLLSEKEVDSITTPLCKMLAESEAFKNIGEYSNQIALVMACLTVFMPRIFVTLSKQKERKKNEITGNSVDTNVRTGTGKSKIAENPKFEKPNREHNGLNAPTIKDNGNNVPWYGSALA